MHIILQAHKKGKPHWFVKTQAGTPSFRAGMNRPCGPEIERSTYKMKEFTNYLQSDKEELRKDDGSYTAIAYDDDILTIAEQATYDSKEEAIRFAKSRNWDEVRDDNTGKIIWRR